MTDTHCQICGTDNPQGSEFCQLCGARLLKFPEVNNGDSSNNVKEAEQLSGETLIKAGGNQSSENSVSRNEVADQSQEKDSGKNEMGSSIQKDEPDDSFDISSQKDNQRDESLSQSDEPGKADEVGDGSNLIPEEPDLSYSYEPVIPDWSVSEGEKHHENSLGDKSTELQDRYEEKGINESEKRGIGEEKKAASESEIEAELKENAPDFSVRSEDTELIEEKSAGEKSLESSETDQLTDKGEDEEAASEPALGSKNQISDGEGGSGGTGDEYEIESADHAVENNEDWVYENGTFRADQSADDTKEIGDESADLSEEEGIQPQQNGEEELSEEILSATHQPGVDLSSGRSWSDWEKILPNESMPQESVSTGEKRKAKGKLETTKDEENVSVEEDENRPSLGKDLPAEQPTEDHGPLADLHGILPGSEKVNFKTVPAVYSRYLHLSDAQRVQMGMLENILAEEEQPRPYIPQRTRKAHRLAQILLILVFLILLALPIFMEMHLLALPQIIPLITNDFYKIVENTLSTPGSQILIAAEYEPGYAGEIGAASLPVIDRLMERDAYLTIVSTYPTGPALAQSLLVQSNQYHQGYSLEQSTLNLGYLAGNANALQQFALQPQQAAKYALNSTSMWNMHPALMNITTVGDYDLIIVLTNNIDKAKLWLEQVQPLYADDIQVLFVASAQTAPILTPYIDSGQIDGMIAGLAGGVAYEQLTQSSIKGRVYWDSYQTGIALTIVLILFGAIYQVFNSTLGRRKKGRRV